MAKLIFSLRIEGAASPKQAVGVGQEVIAMLRGLERRTPHVVEGSVQIPCPACGTNLSVKGQELICPTCENSPEAQAWREFVKDVTTPSRRQRRFNEPEQALEALLT